MAFKSLLDVKLSSRWCETDDETNEQEPVKTEPQESAINCDPAVSKSKRKKLRRRTKKILQKLKEAEAKKDNCKSLDNYSIDKKNNLIPETPEHVSTKINSDGLNLKSEATGTFNNVTCGLNNELIPVSEPTSTQNESKTISNIIPKIDAIENKSNSNFELAGSDLENKSDLNDAVSEKPNPNLENESDLIVVEKRDSTLKNDVTELNSEEYSLQMVTVEKTDLNINEEVSKHEETVPCLNGNVSEKTELNKDGDISEKLSSNHEEMKPTFNDVASEEINSNNEISEPTLNRGATKKINSNHADESSSAENQEPSFNEFNPASNREESQSSGLINEKSTISNSISELVIAESQETISNLIKPDYTVDGKPKSDHLQAESEPISESECIREDSKNSEQVILVNDDEPEPILNGFVSDSNKEDSESEKIVNVESTTTKFDSNDSEKTALESVNAGSEDITQLNIVESTNDETSELNHTESEHKNHSQLECVPNSVNLEEQISVGVPQNGTALPEDGNQMALENSPLNAEAPEFVSLLHNSNGVQCPQGDSSGPYNICSARTNWWSKLYYTSDWNKTDCHFCVVINGTCYFGDKLDVYKPEPIPEQYVAEQYEEANASSLPLQAERNQNTMRENGSLVLKLGDRIFPVYKRKPKKCKGTSLPLQAERNQNTMRENGSLVLKLGDRVFPVHKRKPKKCKGRK